uniref:Uncharacterized protein n=1 Tax=Corethron hystrix TaxID=216773 RepID=A0A7S1G020_9STRA
MMSNSLYKYGVGNEYGKTETTHEFHLHTLLQSRLLWASSLDVFVSIVAEASSPARSPPPFPPIRTWDGPQSLVPRSLVSEHSNQQSKYNYIICERYTKK